MSSGAIAQSHLCVTWGCPGLFLLCANFCILLLEPYRVAIIEGECHRFEVHLLYNILMYVLCYWGFLTFIMQPGAQFCLYISYIMQTGAPVEYNRTYMGDYLCARYSSWRTSSSKLISIDAVRTSAANKFRLRTEFGTKHQKSGNILAALVVLFLVLGRGAMHITIPARTLNLRPHTAHIPRVWTICTALKMSYGVRILVVITELLIKQDINAAANGIPHIASPPAQVRALPYWEAGCCASSNSGHHTYIYILAQRRFTRTYRSDRGRALGTHITIRETDNECRRWLT